MNRNVMNALLVQQAYDDHERRYEICRSFSKLKYMVIQDLHTPVALSAFSYYVTYNSPIQIEVDIDFTLPITQLIPILILSALITDYQIDIQNIFKLNCQSFITVTYENGKFYRNVFYLMSIAPRIPGSPVLYAEDFCIYLYDKNSSPLFLSIMVQPVDNFREIKDRVRVYFTSTPDRFSRFRFVDPNPEKYYRLKYTPVPTFKRVMIVHTITNLVLTADLNQSILSTYSVDHPVLCSAYRTHQKPFSFEYYWKITTMPYGAAGEYDAAGFAGTSSAVGFPAAGFAATANAGAFSGFTGTNTAGFVGTANATGFTGADGAPGFAGAAGYAGYAGASGAAAYYECGNASYTNSMYYN